MNICIFGDSIVWGLWDKEAGGWAERLRLSLAFKGFKGDIYNLGISGDTSDGLLRRFESEALARDADIVIISIGVNDSATDESGNLLTSPQQFEQNLRDITGSAQDGGLLTIFLDLTNIDESKTNPVPWAGVYYSEEDLIKYSEIIKTIADESGSDFCSVRGLLKNEDLSDGLHPNEIGHAKIAATVEYFLINNNIVSI